MCSLAGKPHSDSHTSMLTCFWRHCPRHCFYTQHTPTSQSFSFVLLTLTFLKNKNDLCFSFCQTHNQASAERNGSRVHHHLVFVFIFSYSVPWDRFNTNSAIFLSVRTLGIPLKKRSLDRRAGSLVSLAPFHLVLSGAIPYDPWVLCSLGSIFPGIYARNRWRYIYS